MQKVTGSYITRGHLSTSFPQKFERTLVEIRTSQTQSQRRDTKAWELRLYLSLVGQFTPFHSLILHG